MTTLDAMVDPDLRTLIDSVVQAHAGNDEGLWNALVELGLSDLTGSEERGGSGASWPEAAALARTLARHGCSLTVADSDLVAGWLLEQASAPATQALRGVVIGDDEPTPSAAAALVERVVVVRRAERGWTLSDVPVEAMDRFSDGEFDAYPVGDDVVAAARTRRALVRAIQVTGALEAITELTIEHAQTREQFGRPIGKQQAVQRLVAIVAGETALARAATDAAVLAAADPAMSARQVSAMVAVARSCCGHAVDPVVRHAHQVVGAIGTTREHRLHEFTFAAMKLRSDGGATRDWDAAVLDHAIRSHPLSDLELSPTSTSERI
ncbi:MAG: acyl-CoA dehydrogenase family protein [Mycobacterium sp.]